MQYELDMASPFKELFLGARNVLLGFEEIAETRKDRITTYGTARGGVCHMRTMPDGVDVGFLKGSLIEDDEYGLLVTRGNSKRIRVYSFDELDQAKLEYYVQQSLALIQ